MMKCVFKTISHAPNNVFIKSKGKFILTKGPKTIIHNQQRYLCSQQSYKTETVQTHTTNCSTNVNPEKYRYMMRKLPQPVVLVTTAVFKPEIDSWFKRGLTCTSLLSISLHPPFVSFCLYKHSKISELLHQSQQFAVNFINEHQLKYADIFSRPPEKDIDQFSEVAHYLTKEGVPVLKETSAMLCKVNCVHNVGDHSVWYGQVTELLQKDVNNPILHYNRSYHKVGSVIKPTIQPEQLSNCLQLIWSDAKEYGTQNLADRTRENLRKNILINDSNWHETVIRFYIDMVQIALKAETSPVNNFEEFLLKNEEFAKPEELLLNYYSKDVILSEESKTSYILPNKKSLPTS